MFLMLIQLRNTTGKPTSIPCVAIGKNPTVSEFPSAFSPAKRSPRMKKTLRLALAFQAAALACLANPYAPFEDQSDRFYSGGAPSDLLYRPEVRNAEPSSEPADEPAPRVNRDDPDLPPPTALERLLVEVEWNRRQHTAVMPGTQRESPEDRLVLELAYEVLRLKEENARLREQVDSVARR